jgi:hypothetical protein
MAPMYDCSLIEWIEVKQATFYYSMVHNIVHT